MRRPLLLIVLAALVVLAIASVPLFILYDDDRVAKADAVIVLAGEKRRLPNALELVERGVAPVLFERCSHGHLDLVGSPDPGWRLPRAIGLEWAKLGRATVGRAC